MTGYGFTGPMTAMGTVFDAKAEGGADAPTGGRFLPLTGAGGLLLVLRIMLVLVLGGLGR